MDHFFSSRRRGIPFQSPRSPRHHVSASRIVPTQRSGPRFRQSPLSFSSRFRTQESMRSWRDSPPFRSSPPRGRPNSPPGRNFGYGPPEYGRDRGRPFFSSRPPFSYEREYERGGGRSPVDRYRYERSPIRGYGDLGGHDRSIDGPLSDHYHEDRSYYGRDWGYERLERDRYGDRGRIIGYNDRRGVLFEDRGLLKRGQLYSRMTSPRKRPRLIR